MSTPIQCPHCFATLPTTTPGGPAVENCPLCQKALPGTTPPKVHDTAPAAEGAAWWLGGQAPPEQGGGTATMPAAVAVTLPASSAVVTHPAPAPASTPRLELPPAPVHEPVDFLRKVPEPEKPVVPRAPVAEPPAADEGSPWGGLAVLLGFVAFGIAWVPKLGYFGIALGGLGLALGALVQRRRSGYAASLAGAGVSLLALLFAAAVVYGFARLYDGSAKAPTTEIDQPPQGGPGRTTIVVLNTDDLLEAVKSKDTEARKKAIDSLAGMARGVADAVPALTERLLSDDDARIRAAFAAALGELGPQARSAYPALMHVQLNDGDKSVQEAALTAMDKIGKPSSFDVPFIVKGLQDKRTGYRASVAQTLSWVCTPENKASAPLLKDALSVEIDPRVKLYVAQALWAIDRQPREVVFVFSGLLHNDDSAIRAGAAHALGYLGQEAKLAKPDLRKRLSLPEEIAQVKLYAAQVLWYLDPEKETADLVVPVLGKILKAKDPAYRSDAAQVLVNIGPRATAALDDLIDALKDPSNDPDQRGRCAYALASMGPEAAPAVRVLAELLSTGGGALSEHAAFALRRIGPKAVGALPELIAALRDQNIRVRGQAALTIAAIGDGARAAVLPLTTALERNDDPNIRVLLAQALWVVDRHAPTVLPVLLDVAQDTKLLSEVRLAAINVLAAMGPAAKVAHPMLQRLQDENDDALKAAAAAAAERIGQVTVDDVPTLIKGLDSSSLTLRKAAAETLTALRDEAKDAVPALRRAFGDGDLALRLAAAEALGAIGPDAKDAVPELAAALKEPTLEVRGASLDALRGIGPDAKDVLLKVLACVTDKDARIRAAALTAAAGISDRDPDFHKALEGRMKDEDGRIRVVAAEIYLHVKKGKTDVVLPVLTEALNDSKAEVKSAAIAVLGDIGPAAQVAIPRLTELSKDQNETVRKSAQEALKKIGPTTP